MKQNKNGNEEGHIAGNWTAIKMARPRHENAGVQSLETGGRMEPIGEKELRQTSQHM
jgi:hypothetical protein